MVHFSFLSFVSSLGAGRSAFGAGGRGTEATVLLGGGIRLDEN